MKKFIRGLLLSAAAFAWMGSANAIPVAVELALLVDVSGSVDDTEYALQKTGYVNAFNDPVIQQAIGNLGGIAVTYIEWSGSSQQSQLIGWTGIFNSADASNFANTLAATNRAYDGSTAPGSAINFAFPLFDNNGFEGNRQVIDVSGDGIQNAGANTANARDAALAAGIDAINGLPIGGTSLETWYKNNIQGGTDSFVILASDFDNFETAIKQKLKQEIDVVPTPVPLAMMALGLLGLGTARRMKSRKNT